MGSKTVVKKQYDIVVVGGGMSGVCAAIAAARHGAKTAIIQNRPVFGGNASSEIRMHICGADCHGTRSDARETGILEEILLENRRQNPQISFSVFDTVIWEKVRFQKNLDMYLNTHMSQAITENNKIVKVIAEQITTEKILEFDAKIFVDATGDGTLAYSAGAEYMFGREGKDVFGEAHAPDRSDTITMGSTLLFKAVDTGYPVPFVKPFRANTYKEEDLAYREHNEISSGYWWIELGGDETNIIADGEVIRDELLKAVYGVWDHIKNSGHHNADNFVLDWIGFLPGKRESRRITGEYVLKEQDCFTGRFFEDAVAYGGWPMDMHVVGGLRTRLEPALFLNCDEMYTIPYRSLYSKDISNLLLGGRAISASHMAFGSTRVMATCAVVGQAVGTAGAMAIAKGITPKEVKEYIKDLQQMLMKDDCFIPGVRNEEPKDLSRKARVSCSSFMEGGDCENIINGISRKVKENTNCWISGEMGTEREWLNLDFGGKVYVGEVHFKFDSNLSKELMPSLSHNVLGKQVPGIPVELVKDYTIEFYRDGKLVHSIVEKGNHFRFKVHKMQTTIECDNIKIVVEATNGDRRARIFEVRVY